MTDSGFWKVRQAECERYAQQFPELRAVWNANYGTWKFWWGSTLQVPAKPAAALNDVAKKCATQLPNAVAIGDAMTQLLDYLREFMQEREWYFDPIAADRASRERKWGFQVTHDHPVSKRVWMAGVRSGRPPVQVRKDLGEEEESEPYRWLESGRFEHIFQALAVLFADFAGRAFELEEAESGAGQANDVSAREATATESSSGSIPKDSLGINPVPKRAPQHVAPTRRWSIVTGISGEGQQQKLRERFEQVVREALAELCYRFHDPFGAVEAWLDFLLKESSHRRGGAINDLGTASRHELAELRILAKESGNTALAATLGKLEAGCEFPQSLHAILRGDFCALPEDIRGRVAKLQASQSTPKQRTGQQYLGILQTAMEQKGLNPPKLAAVVRAILKRKKGRRPMVDRSTMYRILNGETKKPQPAVRNAVIEALELKGEEASIVQRGLGGTPAI